MTADDGLVKWAARSGRCRPSSPRGNLRFAFYRRVSTEDWQDPGSSLTRQREQAGPLVRGAQVSADLVGNLMDVATARRRAEPGDLSQDTHLADGSFTSVAE
jgi:hypothetical protein